MQAAVIIGIDTTAGANWRTAAAHDFAGDTEYRTDGYIVYGLDGIEYVRETRRKIGIIEQGWLVRSGAVAEILEELRPLPHMAHPAA